tara:strand:+ start:223 stop:612 length:390 start_codon:yes stop_codon:yes gene_type:complete
VIMERSIQRRRGMTLIEVLIALAILGAGLFGLMMAASRCLAVVTTARDYELARRTLDLGELDHPALSAVEVSDLEVFGRSYDTGLVYSRSVEEIDGDEDMFILRSFVKNAGGTRTLLSVAWYLYTTNHP